MKTIKCKCGKDILIDDVDEPNVMHHRWDCRANRGAVVNNGFSLSWLVIGCPDEKQTVDHIDGDTHNNQKSNLRFATFSQNNHSRPPGRNNHSGYKGVSFNNKNGKWIAQINKDRKTIHLGTFSTPESAAEAYNKKSREFYGDFSFQNTITPTQSKQ